MTVYFETTAPNDDFFTQQTVDLTTAQPLGIAGIHSTTLPSLTINGAISVPGDTDVYRISLRAGDVVTLDVDNQGVSFLDTILRLRDSGFVELAVSDDMAAADPGSAGTLDPFLSLTIASSGIHYIAISAFGGVTTGNYALNVTISSIPLVLSAGVGQNIVAGWLGNDSITGFDPLVGPETIGKTLRGLAGNDTLRAGDGNDSLDGGTGRDLLRGGRGADTLVGDTGNDSLYGDIGDDLLYGAAGNDRLNGASGADWLIGGEGNDLLSGGTGNDRLDLRSSDPDLRGRSVGHGGDGADTIFGDAGDVLSGDAGDDVLHVADSRATSNALAAHVDGGAGNDLLRIELQTDPVVVPGSPSVGAASGNVYFTADDDGFGYLFRQAAVGTEQPAGTISFRGIERFEILGAGLTGNDTLSGGTGDDLLRGDGGTDRIAGDDGADTIVGGTGQDELYGEDGADLIFTQTDATASGLDRNYVEAGDGADTVYAQCGDNADGGDGDDLFILRVDLSSAFQAQLAGGTGLDRLALLGQTGAPFRVVLDQDGTGRVLTWGMEERALLSGIEALIIAPQGPAGSGGFAFADEFGGGIGGDSIDAGAGADTISGNDGNDTLGGDAGLDRLDGGDGDDLLDGGGDADTMTGGFDNDTMLGGAGDDLLRGGHGNDSIHGTTGADVIEGWDGADTLGTGFSGEDTAVVFGGRGADLILIGGAVFADGGDGDDRFVMDIRGSGLVVGGAGVDVLEADLTLATAAAELELFGEGGGLLMFGSDLLMDVDSIEAFALTGTAFADRFLAGDANDTLRGGEGSDRLTGSGGADSLDGGNGNDIIAGGAGADTLDGGAGRDAFRYSNAAEGGDTILFYSVRDDVIQVSVAGFGGGLRVGGLSASLFVASESRTPTAAFGQFLWQPLAGELWWDVDGMGAAAAQMIVRFADGVPALAASEIQVVA